ncbi:MAG: GGDEF domain-containing protein, partial [Colwelliaceae bacterium]|nr:GGDEF domain-containing protein [Colwelliaceae bacterium]
MPSEKFDNIFLIALLTFTVTLFLLQKFSLNHSLNIDINTLYPSQVISDQDANNGKSTVKLIKNKDHFLLDCQIIPSDYNWPFCEITFSFTSENDNNIYTPLDLSEYKQVNISALYTSKNSAGVRFQLRTFNPAYASLENQSSWKYNGLEYWPDQNTNPVIIPMNALQVSTWWLIEQEIPIEYSAPEFDKVMVLEIATGNDIRPGNYQLRLDKIEFIGKIFTNNQVYAFIIFLWVFAAVSGLFINLKRSKIKLEKSISRTKELRQLNKLLNVESQELKDQSERDHLTGALNRSGIEPIFTNEIKTLSLIFIDIDHFKPINDNHGHAIGDKILIEFVKVISENSRSTDFLSRWGGEEFLLICP